MKAMLWRVLVTFSLLVASVIGLAHPALATDEESRLITVYDRGVTTTFLSDAKTLKEALEAQGILLDARDTVEPSIDEELIAPEYNVNIYRARPVIVVDGKIRIKTVSAYQTARQIAADVGIPIYEEDLTILRPSSDLVGDGAGLELTILRSTLITLDLYGSRTEVRTHGQTVGDMLEEKEITLGENDRVSLPLETPITAGLEVRVWREGKQTVSVEQPVPFTTQIIYDADRPLGYRAVQKEGVQGVRSITYEIEVQEGVEVSRVEIANLVTRRPSEQVIVIGLYNDGSGLTVSKGAQYYTDSKGVSHRETYYDLNMNIVMRSCGQGGYYTVRPDGAKVDADGYILVAANYGNYPKCSIVETSLGLGKVYDTGGFALRHPHGFDLATDWTRADGI